MHEPILVDSEWSLSFYTENFLVRLADNNLGTVKVTNLAYCNFDCIKRLAISFEVCSFFSRLIYDFSNHH